MKERARLCEAARAIACAGIALSICACTFDYGVSGEEAGSTAEPDIVMKDVEYVRMVNAQPLVRLRAEEVRRYESTHVMQMDAFIFEQFNAAAPEQTPDVNVLGSGSYANVQTDTGNLIMTDVFVDVKSEELSLNTGSLSWNDKERQLAAPGMVSIVRPNGTRISGRGLSADIRRRRWQFEADVEGSIVEDGAVPAQNPNLGAEERLLETILESQPDDDGAPLFPDGEELPRTP